MEYTLRETNLQQKAELDSLFKEPRVMSKLNGIPHVVSYRGTGYYRTTRQAFDQMMQVLSSHYMYDSANHL